MEYRLAPRTNAAISPRNGLAVRLTDDARKCIVYFGLRTRDNDGTSKVIYGGTGFFVEYDKTTYLVTARHVAEGLAGPFVLGHNLADGSLCESDVDHVEWLYHDSESVDIAVTVAALINADWVVIPPDDFATFASPGTKGAGNFGAGDLVYIVGLYRLFPGKSKITPIVHTGHIAMMPHEDIPMRNRVTGKLMRVRGYLIEAQTLEGLSGSPVFVRYTNVTNLFSSGGRVAAYSTAVYLLGVWLSAWDLPAGETLTQQLGKEARVPVGMGITVPVERIVEVLKSDKLRKQREEARARKDAANAASMDSALPAKPEQSATEVNPSHKEDFTALLGEAAKKRPQDG